MKDVAELLNDPSLNDSSGIVSDFLRATCCTFSAASSIAAFVAAIASSIASYSGYNEIVIDSGTWLSNLPHSIEAIFLVDCSKRQRNTPYSASKSCEQAQANARRVHAAFLAAYGVPESKFPLLRLSQHEWDAPFAAAD